MNAAAAAAPARVACAARAGNEPPAGSRTTLIGKDSPRSLMALVALQTVRTDPR